MNLNRGVVWIWLSLAAALLIGCGDNSEAGGVDAMASADAAPPDASAPSWRNPLRLSELGQFPSVAIDADGRVLVAWYEQLGGAGGSHSAVIRTFDDSTGWGPALVAGTSDFSLRPHVVASPAGGGAAIWSSVSGDSYRIQVKRLSAGGAWSATETVFESAYSRWSPRLAIAADGTAIAVWSVDTDSDESRVMAAVYEPGLGWAGAETISTIHSWEPAVVFDSDGSAIVAWVGDKTQVRRYEPATGWAEVATLNDGSSADTVSLAAANGTAVAVWNGSFDVAASTYSDGAWSTAAAIDLAGALLPDRVEVTMDSQGNAVAVWGNPNTDQMDAWFSRYGPDQGWTTAATVDDGAYPVTGHALASVGGEAAVMWSQSEGPDLYDNPHVWLETQTSNGWSEPMQLDTTGDAGEPALSGNAAGQVAAAWSGGGIYIRLRR